MFVCDTDAQKDGLCTEAQLGQPIIDTTESTSIGWGALDFTTEKNKGIQYFEYHVERTGFYCVVGWTVRVGQTESAFTGVLEFNNKFGTLAGSDFPKLPVSKTLRVSWLVVVARILWRGMSIYLR